MANTTSKATPDSTKYLVFALLVVFFCSYLLFDVFFAGRTSRSTTNGVWNSIDVTEWAYKSKRDRIIGGEVIYVPIMGTLIRLFDSSPHTPYTFQKMAAVNALLGGIASAVFFLIVNTITRRLVFSMVASFFHFVLGFVLLLSTISENVMPGYFFYLIGVLFLFAWLQKPRYVFLFLFSILFVLSWLSQWIFALGIVATVAIGLGIAEINIDKKISSYCLVGLLFGLSFIVMGKYVLHVSILSLIFPGKGLGTGWGGFKLEKVLYLMAGAANYFVGGNNLTNLSALTGARLCAFLMGLVFDILGVFSVVWCLLKESGPTRKLLLALLAGFLVSEGVNFYSQPQDPQMQIQPMLFLSLCIVLAAHAAFGNKPRSSRGPIAAVLGVCLLAAVNLGSVWASTGTDRPDIERVKSVTKTLNMSRSLLVVHGFEGWLSYYSAIVDRNLWRRKPRNLLSVVEVPMAHPDFTAAQTEFAFSEYLADGTTAGYDIYVDDTIWSYDADALYSALATIASRSQSDSIYIFLHSRLKIDKRVPVAAGLVFDKMKYAE
jgi:hypothetical protein